MFVDLWVTVELWCSQVSLLEAFLRELSTRMVPSHQFFFFLPYRASQHDDDDDDILDLKEIFFRK